MNNTDQFDASNRIREVQYAGTPEGLVANGNVESMRRFLLLSGDGVKQDQARQSLFEAAANGLAHSKDKKNVYRLRVYGWPVALSFSGPVQMNSSQNLGKELLLKLRELWARAFGAKHGTLISPMKYASHLTSVLGLNPLRLRDCTRHGVSLVQGTSLGHSWTFDEQGVRIVEGSADEPMTFILSAYVCWDVHGAQPTVDMGVDVAFEMQQLMQGIFAHPHRGVSAIVGRPAVFHDAVTIGQGLQMVAMQQRASALGQSLMADMREAEGRLTLCMGYFDEVEDEQTFAIEWGYPSVWRPMEHVTQMQAYAEQASRAPTRGSGHHLAMGRELRTHSNSIH